MKTTVLACLVATPALAHFVLDQPLSAWAQNPVGDPQKQPPCGNERATMSTSAVTTYESGQTITIRLRETIFHPGHYRVAIGDPGPGALPDPAPVRPGATPCGSTTVQTPPVFPVLADGALLHSRGLSGPQQFSVTLPANFSCTRCTLQVIQFMSDHDLNVPGGCYYSHCATITVVAPDGGTVDAGTVDAGRSEQVDAGDGHAHVHEPTPMGCGCASVEGLLLVPALWLSRRRRAQYE